MGKSKPYGDFMSDPTDNSGLIRAKTEKVTNDTARKRERADRTYSNRSEETIRKQEAAHASKKNSLERIAQLETDLDAKMQELAAKLLEAASTDGTTKAFERYSADIAAFKEFSEELDQLYEKYRNGRKPSDYFSRLIEVLVEQNKDFIRFAPAYMFKKDQGTLLTGTTKEMRDAVQATLEEANMFKDGTIFKNNLKFFPDYISTITNYEDAIFALKLDPSKFNKLPILVVRSFTDNPKLLGPIIIKLPEIFSKLTAAQIEGLYNTVPSAIGLALARCPQNFDCLPSDFFKRHQPKYIFAPARINKAELAQIAAETDLSRFSELVEYIGKFYGSGVGV